MDVSPDRKGFLLLLLLVTLPFVVVLLLAAGKSRIAPPLAGWVNGQANVTHPAGVARAAFPLEAPHGCTLCAESVEEALPAETPSLAGRSFTPPGAHRDLLPDSLRLEPTLENRVAEAYQKKDTPTPIPWGDILVSYGEGQTAWVPYLAVAGVAADLSGNVWFATDRGVSVLTPPGDWTHYRAADGLGADNVSDVIVDPQGRIWVATIGGGIGRFDGAAWQTFTPANSHLPGDRIVQLAGDAQGNVWAVSA